MYADDTTLSINGKNIFEIEATLNENLNSVNMWCTNNNMVINPTKTTCMLIGTKQRKAMMEKEFNIYISRSFINIIKSRGSKMDPCGTPYFTGSGLEMLFPIHKLCFRSDKYDSNHFIEFGIQM
jgi:hypothetical protein